MARKTSTANTASSARPPMADVLEPSVRANWIWNPALLRAAEINATGGHLMLAADLCRWILADDRVKAVLDSRTDALLGRQLSFEAGLGRRRRAAVKAIDIEEDWYASFPETEIKALHAWGIMLGVGLAEIRWEEDEAHGGRLLPRLEVKDPRWLRYDQQSREWRLTVAGSQGFASEEITITPGDGKWILFTPGGKHRPWDHGCYRALGLWVLLKEYAKQDWAFVSEKHGIAQSVITGTGGTQAQRDQMLADVKRKGRNLGFMLPEGFKYDLIEAQASTGEIFARQIAAADTGIAVTIQGNNLTTQISAGDGSKAAASEHGKVSLGRTKADAETLSTCIHDGALTWWALYNFADAALAPWPVWDCRPLEDQKDRAAALQMLGQFVAQASSANTPVDFHALLLEFDVPMLAAAPGKAKSQIYQYDIELGIVTKNERRAALGLDPVDGGDVPVTPVESAPAAARERSQVEVVSLLARLPASHPARAHHEIRARIAAAQAA